MSKFAIPRYIPADSFEVKRGGVDAVVYLYRSISSGLCAIGYKGKSNKSVFNYRYPSEQKRSESVDKFFEGLKKDAEYKANYKNDAKAKQAEVIANLKVGDLFYSSWGYDQTNVDFYKIVGKKNKMVEIVEVGKVLQSSSGSADYVVADSSRIIGEVMKKFVSAHGSIKVRSCANAYPWDGKPKYETAAGYGH